MADNDVLHGGFMIERKLCKGRWQVRDSGSAVCNQL